MVEFCGRVAVVSPCKEDGWFANGGMAENGPIKPTTVRSHPDRRDECWNNQENRLHLDLAVSSTEPEFVNV
jgi:hypothetical protein